MKMKYKIFSHKDFTHRRCGEDDKVVRLYSIRAVKSFSDVKKGDLGGFIEKEENLSQHGDAWIYDEAIVFGDAEVSGSAQIREKAEIYGNVAIYGNAIVSGNAEISGEARVCESARITGNAVVRDTALIAGNTVVSGDSRVLGDTRLLGNVRILIDEMRTMEEKLKKINGDLIQSELLKISNAALKIFKNL